MKEFSCFFRCKQLQISSKYILFRKRIANHTVLIQSGYATESVRKGAKLHNCTTLQNFKRARQNISHFINFKMCLKLLLMYAAVYDSGRGICFLLN